MGQVRATADTAPQSSPQPFDHDAIRQALRWTSFVRAFETKVLALTRTDPPGIAGSVHLCAGQEAVAYGAVAGLREDDPVIATYRGHAWALAAGLDDEAVLAEICHREAGINGGRAGSAFMLAPHTRFIGENSIVGAGTTQACGVALANLAAGNGRVVLVSIGDGAMNQGATHEAMAFAAARALPVIFLCEHNGWSELTPTGDMFRVSRLARRAGGYGMQSTTIAGTDPAVVRDTVAIAAQRARDGDGPMFIECRVPRLWGHYNKDIEHYRPAADKKAAAAEDPLALLGQRLIDAGAMSADEVDALHREQEEAVDALAERVLAMPRPDPATATDHVLAPPIDAPAPAVRETREMTYAEAVNTALRDELQSQPATVFYGEDVGKAGGIFGVGKLLQRDFGADRVFDTPIAENAILGSAVGAALSGLRPIVEIMWADFVFVAFDQLINQAANIRYVTRGQSSVPMVVRMQQGATPGSCSQHSQCIEGLLTHIPGLKVALAATPADAYSLLRSAAADPDPCVVIEARALYWTKGEVALTDGAESVGRARRHRSGGDATILTWGSMLPRALEAAEQLAGEGIETTVVDLRWLNPMDHDAVAQAVADGGGRVLVVHEAARSGGFGAELASRIHEAHESLLSAPIRRLTTPDTRIPASPDLQAVLIPDAPGIAAAVRELIAA